MDPIKTLISRPIFTSMLIMAVVVFGLFAFPKIGVDQYPDVEFPVVTVTVVRPGADPESMERDVADPLEEVINTLSGLETLKSINVESVTQIVVQFELGKNVDVAAQEIRDKVQSQLSKLPPEIQAPVVEKFDIGAAPIMTLALSGPLPVEELTRIAKDEVKPMLQQTNGVGSIDLVGGREREITVTVNPDRLRSYGLAVTDVAGALKAQNVDVPGGRMQETGRERTVKLTSQVKTVDELRNLIIPAPTASPVRIQDVANVIDGPQEARSVATFNGTSAVALVIRKQSGANTTAVAEEVKNSLAEISSRLPEGLQVDMVMDGAKFIRASIHSVQEDLVLGGLLAVVIVLVFLRNGRSTLISAIALPTSVIGTFAAMKALNFTFNSVTMLALTLSIGLLIDDAIVVIENIVRHIEEGASPFKAALEGTKEIALAVFAVTLSIVAVFIPVAFMDGMVGQFFYQFGVTVAVAVAISFFISLTLTPMLSARLLSGHGSPGRISLAIERVLVGIESFYRKALAFMLRHRGLVIGAAVVVLVATLGLARFIKTTFIPAQDMGYFKVAVEMPIGTDLDSTQDVIRGLEAQIREVPGVDSLYASVGGGAQEQVHKGEILVNLVPIHDRSYKQEEIKQFLRESLVFPPDVKMTVQDYNGMGGGAAQEIQFNIRGTNWDDVLASADKVQKAMRESGMFVDVDSTYRTGKPQIDVQLDRDRAADLGIPAATVGQALRTFLGGDKVAEYREKGKTYEVKIRLPPDVLADEGKLSALTVRGASGGLVEVRNIAKVQPGEGPTQIDRQARERQITILADLAHGHALGEGMGFLTNLQNELPKSVITGFDGRAKELGRTAISFLTALLLGIILVYMILAAQFESLLDPFTIMMALPFAVIGALGGLLITGQFMSMFAMIGMIMLMGLVTKNGILLVDFTKQLRAQGKSTYEALMEAGPIRLRPILMTTLAMIFGMIPPAIASGDGAESRNGMAVAIIGGLITSTVLTLGVVPVVYSLFDGAKARVSRLFKRGKGAEAAPHDLAA
ncbi:efflux RND transporter permease subunit [Vulgatibacter incomptus]|uniref:Cobalt-zinc-cadmium resistance protein CzcA n=1 Tax=Vulgatibacter incomptus TaxID=1391653 RepID=A0A0K1PGU1_9BACT|nr:efflux RND transporter permease subunit [Vulgatibacter incomptus]AKU92339.1 Cobalt-zinc-cadmium resistance protein CzcA [Vulgatibacter incomptus]